MKRTALAALVLAALFTVGCASGAWSKIKPDRRIVVDAEMGEPIAGAEVRVVVHRRDTMEIEATETAQADERGRVVIPGKENVNVAAAQFGVKPKPREQSYWIHAPGYLPTYVDLWSNTASRTLHPGLKLRVLPESTADSLPAEVVYRTRFITRGDQSLFVPVTATDGPVNLGLLGVRGFLPLADAFERCGCKETIEQRLDGARVAVSVDETTGLFVDWPETEMVHMQFADGEDVGAWLISEGLAVVDFRFAHSKRAEYERLEDEAVAESRGVWGVLKEMGADEK